VWPSCAPPTKSPQSATQLVTLLNCCKLPQSFRHSCGRATTQRKASRIHTTSYLTLAVPLCHAVAGRNGACGKVARVPPHSTQRHAPTHTDCRCAAFIIFILAGRHGACGEAARVPPHSAERHTISQPLGDLRCAAVSLAIHHAFTEPHSLPLMAFGSCLQDATELVAKLRAFHHTTQLFT
jgi:hypothetical protein